MSTIVSNSFSLTIPESYMQYSANFSSNNDDKDEIQTVFGVKGAKFAPYFNGMTYYKMIQGYFDDHDIVNRSKKGQTFSKKTLECCVHRIKIFEELMRWNLAKNGNKYSTRKGEFYHTQVTIHSFLATFFSDNPKCKNPFPNLATVIEHDENNENEVVNHESFVYNVVPNNTRSTKSVENFINMKCTDGKYKGYKYIDVFNDTQIMSKLTNIFTKREKTNNCNTVGNIEHLYHWTIEYADHIKPFDEIILIEGSNTHKGQKYIELYQDLDFREEMETFCSPDQYAQRGSIAHFLYWSLNLVNVGQPTQFSIDDISLIEGEHQGKKYSTVYGNDSYVEFLVTSYTADGTKPLGTICHFLEYVRIKDEQVQR